VPPARYWFGGPKKYCEISQPNGRVGRVFHRSRKQQVSVSMWPAPACQGAGPDQFCSTAYDESNIGRTGRRVKINAGRLSNTVHGEAGPASLSRQERVLLPCRDAWSVGRVAGARSTGENLKVNGPWMAVRSSRRLIVKECARFDRKYLFPGHTSGGKEPYAVGQGGVT